MLIEGGPIFGGSASRHLFFGFLEVCMSGPEEDLAQGGCFLMWPERFINFLNINLFQINFQINQNLQIQLHIK